MQKLSSLTLRQCWYGIMCIMMPIICVGGVSFFLYHLRYPLLIIAAAGSFIVTLATKKALKFTLINTTWLVASVIMMVTVTLSYSPKESVYFASLFLFSTLVLFTEFPEGFWNRFILVCEIIAIIISITIIASVFIDGLMPRYLWFLTNPFGFKSLDNQMYTELRIGAYSGLANEKAEAAVIMNVGIAAVVSKLMAGNRIKAWDIVKLAMFTVALTLTGKRMLTLIPVVTFILLMPLSSVKHKAVKFLLVTLLFTGGLILLSSLIPQISGVFERFVGDSDSAYYSHLSGRERLWKYSFLMFRQSPVVGYGLGSFNDFAYDNGYLYRGQRWNYYGHNCYYEALGEIGIIGAVTVFALFAAALVISIRLLKKEQLDTNNKKLVLFSVQIQLLMLFYSISGNVFYQSDQLFLWFMAMAMVFSVREKFKSRTSVGYLRRLSNA